jgi:hypothetical protein
MRSLMQLMLALFVIFPSGVAWLQGQRQPAPGKVAWQYDTGG